MLSRLPNVSLPLFQDEDCKNTQTHRFPQRQLLHKQQTFTSVSSHQPPPLSAAPLVKQGYRLSCVK